MSNSRLYDVYMAMLQRCRNPNCKAYSWYGERGIGLHDDWLRFENWHAYVCALDPGPAPGLTLDRIDNDGNYEPGNVRWVPRSVQNTNKRPRKRKKHRRADIADIQTYVAALTRAASASTQGDQQ
jgi:hypothetical protein